MTGFLAQVLWQTWEILKEASVFLLLGFALAGVLAVFVPAGLLGRLVGRGKVRSVLWASAIGAPLPLCSCGVVPMMLGLRRQGATPGATVAFLVATPETGVDSISLSYALTDPILTVARPLAGVLTAIVAGLATNFLGWRPPPAADHRHDEDCGHAHSHVHRHDLAPDHDHAHECGDASEAEPATPAGLGTVAGQRQAIGRVYRYAFRELLDETSYWLVLGILLSGVVAAALPPGVIGRYLDGGWLTMLAMLLVSVPVYTCASSSTPLAAALVLKGLSPGAALVFLLAGPATNLGSLVLLLKFLGPRIVAVYLSAVVGMTLLAGWATDLVYRGFAIDPRLTFGAGGEVVPEPLKVAGALLLIALLCRSMWRTHVPREWIWARDQVARVTGLRLGAAQLGVAALAATFVLYLASGLFQVGPGESGLRERFGRVIGPVLGPGLHVRLPWPIASDRVIRAGEVRRMEFGFARQLPSRAERTRAATGVRASYGGNAAPDAMRTAGAWFQREPAAEDPFLLTGDANLIDLKSAVQYRIRDPLAYAYTIADPEALVRGTVLSALRGVVARRSIDAIYTTAREAIERQVARAAQAALDRYGAGIEVVSFRLLYVHPPDVVHQAFRDVASAQEDKLRTVNRARIFAVETVNQAKADRVAMIAEAEAAKSRDITRAKGDAAAFGLRLEAYRRAPELTRFRLQIETIEAVLPGVRKLVRPGAGAVKDFDLWLLQPPAAAR